jgi:hypothetical protein
MVPAPHSRAAGLAVCAQRGVVVADVDWGFRTTHSEFEGALELTYNAVDGGADVTHGTHAAHSTAVIGLAAARANGTGMTGCALEAAIWAVQGDSAPNPPRSIGRKVTLKHPGIWRMSVEARNASRDRESHIASFDKSKRADRDVGRSGRIFEGASDA